MTGKLKPRRVQFDWSDTPLHWVPGDPQTSHSINALSLLLPAGEAWFVRVYRQALPLVTDEKLREDVKGFMGQEAIHGRSHAALLDHLKEQGLDAEPFTKRVDWLFEKLLGDNPKFRWPGKSFDRYWLKQRLAIIAAIEHFTAVLGDWIINSPGLDKAGADPTMLDLLRWHGAEEVEHRTVAYDLYQHLSGGYLRRVWAMLVTFLQLAFWMATGARYLLHHDPVAPGKLSWRTMRRAQRLGRFPSLLSIAGAVPDYLAPNYHPEATGSTEQAVAYLAGSPAALAAAS